MTYKGQSIVLTKSEDFALQIISVYTFLQTKKEFVLSRQLLRSATSIGANISEAVAAQSTNDFIHKLSIALKEAHETSYWLRLLDKSQIVKYDYDTYNNECIEIICMLSKIILSTKLNNNL